ncbi:MAG: hypothetical protein WD156_08725 [Acidimicrobiia bacterium]
MSDPFELIRLANPVPDPDRMPDEPDMASSEALVEEIIGMNNTGSKTRTRAKRLRRTLLAAATMVLLGATAAIGGVFESGNLDEPPFSGDGWQLIVGQEANNELATSWKVCHKFSPDEGPDEANGFGPSGCVTWPDDATDTIIMDAIAFTTPDGQHLLFVDLTGELFDTVSVVLDDSPTVEVAPFAIPGSGKQFAVIELPAGADTAEVQLLNDGEVIERRGLNVDTSQ